MRIRLESFQGSCSCGRNHQIDVKKIVLGNHAAEELQKDLREGDWKQYQNPFIICDAHTKAAAWEKLRPVWELCREIVLPPEGLHADNHGVDLVDRALEEAEAAGAGKADLLLAVGSGTIHDLSRYVSFHKGIPFLSVPTAASVDGFVSTVAAMTWDGMKKTLPAAAPVAVYADTEIFSRAPYRLTASGISDLMGKYIALADWRIAHLVTGEYLCERVCHMEMEALEAVRDCLAGLRQGEGQAYEKLMYALLLSGLAMQMIGNSRPASCAEHHVSHLWEMAVINDPIDALHGEKVSVGLVLNLELYKTICQKIKEGACRVIPYAGLEKKLLEETFGKKGLYESVLLENTPDPMLDVDPERLQNVLPEIAEIIDGLPEPEKIEELLDLGGCVRSAEQIGIPRTKLELTMQLSPYVRNRLSFNRIRKMLAWETAGQDSAEEHPTV